MKRIIFILLCFILAAGCAGCAQTGNEESPLATGDLPGADSTTPSPDTATPDNTTDDTTPVTTPDVTPDDNTPNNQPNRKEDPINMNIADIINYLESEGFAAPAGFDKKTEGVEYGEITEVEYYSNTTQAVRKCNIYTPPGFDTDSETAYPVLYLLHGIGGTHNEWKSGSPNEILSNMIASGEIRPMIVVMPNIRAKQNDTDLSDMFGIESIRAFDNFINDLRDDLMPFISENYPVSSIRENNMVAGLSMGGREALFIGVSMPETFSFVGAFCPAPGLISMNMGIPGQIDAEDMKYTDEYNDKTFVLINAGNSDGVVGDNPLRYFEALDNNGANSFYYSIDGGHDFNVWKNGLYYFLKCAFLGDK